MMLEMPRGQLRAAAAGVGTSVRVRRACCLKWLDRRGARRRRSRRLALLWLAAGRARELREREAAHG